MGRNIRARPVLNIQISGPARYIFGIWDTGKCKLPTVAKCSFWEKRPGPFFDIEFTARADGPPGPCRPLLSILILHVKHSLSSHCVCLLFVLDRFN
jgi:hypothetical protein